MEPLRLAIEPIPASSRLASLANLLPRDQWDRLRRAMYRQACYRCQLCGREGSLHCHEVWQYNEQTGRQWLAGFQAICSDCHGVKHIHFARPPGMHANLLRHFAVVNHLTPDEAGAYLAAAWERQRWLDQRRWVVDYGAYNAAIPALRNSQHRRDFLYSSGHRQLSRVPTSLLACESDHSWEADYDS